MKAKYIESEFPRYFIFGEYADGLVDVASEGNDCVVSRIGREDAERLISARAEIIDRMADMATAFEAASDEAFTAFWYGK